MKPKTDSPLHRTLTGAEEIGAYLHATRMRILEVLAAGPATLSQIAAAMGVHPANLTRHARVLQNAGLIRLVRREDRGRVTEKYYAATAASFDLAPEIDGVEVPQKLALGFARSDLSAAIQHLPAEGGAVAVHLVRARIDAARVAEFAGELDRLRAQFEAAEGEAGDAFHLLLALYPGGPDVEGGAQIRITVAEE
jgi:DNA-binding transcriptional ArsR family regulator